MKEYVFATEVLVLGRGAEYNLKTDSTVRAGASRLSARLTEYYATEGRDDPVEIGIPKGSYVMGVCRPANSRCASRHETELEVGSRWAGGITGSGRTGRSECDMAHSLVRIALSDVMSLAGRDLNGAVPSARSFGSKPQILGRST